MVKTKKLISILLSLTLFYFITATVLPQYALAAEGDTVTLDDPVIDNSNNYISLNWKVKNTINNSDVSTNYSYTVLSKKSDDADKDYQVIPTKYDTETTDKNNVKVLNIFPKEGNALKEWMENPVRVDGKDYPNGFGQGIISVTPIDMKTFNIEPKTQLKNEDGSWKYDVLVFGFSDYNSSEDLDKETSLPLVRDFIKSGRGVLFGHDTINEYVNTNFASLAECVNMKTKGGRNFSANTIFISKLGLLTNYPYKIGNLNTKLTIQPTHSDHQVASGDVWMKLSNSNEFYLTTWNNCAMIQTGHYSEKTITGEKKVVATTDEQKVLANTIYYLAQITNKTCCADHKAQDSAAPNKPNITKAIKSTSSNKTSISISPTKDNGTSYDYYVEAKENSTGNTIKSNTVTSDPLTSGLKGYYIVTDQNENTKVSSIGPDGKEAKIYAYNPDGTYTVDKTFDGDYYVHVAAVDNAGNVSETTTYKVQNIILNVEPEITETSLNKDFSVDLTLDNIDNVIGVDTTIKYDNSKLKFLGFEQAPGISFFNHKTEDGTIALTLFHDSSINVIDTKKTLVKLKFSPISKGNASIDVTNSSVTTGIYPNKDLKDFECGKTAINIVD